MRANIRVGAMVHGTEKRHGLAHTWCGLRYRTTPWWNGYGQVPRGARTTKDVDCMACIAARPPWL